MNLELHLVITLNLEIYTCLSVGTVCHQHSVPWFQIRLRNFKHQSAVYHHADGFNYSSHPDGVSTAEKRRKQPMQTLIVDRSMVESEFQKLRHLWWHVGSPIS